MLLTYILANVVLFPGDLISWLIVGLIEAGHLKEAKELLDTFAPKDNRILFSIYLGAVLHQQVRIASPEEKAVAAAIARVITKIRATA